MSEGQGKGQRDDVLVLIAIFKLVKVVLLVALGVGAFELVGHDVGETLTRWTTHAHFDARNGYVHAAITHVTGISDRKLEALCVGTLIYAAVFATEGIGLLLKKRWAEYMTAIVTASFIPFEIWEITQHVSAPKAMATVLNLAIVVYLVAKLKTQRREDRSAASQRSASSTHLRPSTGSS